MSNVVNLRTARKQKRRSQKEATAADNRVKFGQTKQTRAAADADRERSAALLDGKQRVEQNPTDKDGTI